MVGSADGRFAGVVQCGEGVVLGCFGLTVDVADL